MASFYSIPPDTREKERIIGGIFTVSQLIFLIIGLIVGSALAILAFKTTKNLVFTLIMLAIGIAPFVPFAFVKIKKMGDIELAQYLLYKYKYRHSQHRFLNYNENFRGTISDGDTISETGGDK